jgi:hypothetical protein
MDDRQRQVVFSQRRTNQRGSWTTTKVCTPINMIFLDCCRVPSSMTTHSTLCRQFSLHDSHEFQRKSRHINKRFLPYMPLPHPSQPAISP